MVRHVSLFALAVVASLLVGGCVGGGATPASPDAENAGVVELHGSGGAVEGIVTDMELAPVPDAVVAVESLFQTQTDTEGRFAAQNVPVGDHVLLVQALGFESIARKVTVKQDETERIQVQLEKLSTEEIYYETVVLKGLACLQGYVGGVSFTLGTLCTDARSFVPFYPAWHLDSLIAEMEWQPSSAITSSSFYLAIWQGGSRSGVLTCEHCYGNVEGKSPLYLRADGPFKGLKEENDREKNKLENVIFTRASQQNPGGVNLAYNQRFTLYDSMFYGGDAPEGFSARPDQ